MGVAVQSLETLKNYFVDPDNAQSADDLAAMSGEVIKAMAQMYAGRFSPVEQVGVSQKDGVTSPETDELRKILAEVLNREATTRKFDSKFMGQIHPQGNKIGILANTIAAYMNTNTVVAEVSTAENRMEEEVLAHLAGWFGYDKDQFSGNIVSGGTTANLSALWVSREKAYASLGKKRNVNLYVLGTDRAHYSVMKACDLLGPRVIFLKVPEKDFKMDVVALREMMADINGHQSRRDGIESRVMTIIGCGGETETGQVDDLNGIADVAEEYGVHFHVDAAYGGPFVISKQSARFSGIERADSITVDPHKMVYAPYASAAILYRDKRDNQIIEKEMRKNARYLIRSPHSGSSKAVPSKHAKDRNFGLSRVEGSMGSAGVISAWATLQLLGDEGLSTILDNTLELTKHAHDRVEKSHVLRPLYVPELNTLLIGLNGRFGLRKESYDKLLETVRQNADNQGYYISLNEKVDGDLAALRMVIMHPHTMVEDVDNFIALLEKEITEQLPIFLENNN